MMTKRNYESWTFPVTVDTFISVVDYEVFVGHMLYSSGNGAIKHICSANIYDAITSKFHGSR